MHIHCSKPRLAYRVFVLAFGFTLLSVVVLHYCLHSKKEDVELVSQTIQQIDKAWSEVEMFYRTNGNPRSLYESTNGGRIKAKLKSVGPYKGLVSIRTTDIDGAPCVSVYMSYETPDHNRFREKTKFASGPICEENARSIQRFVGMRWEFVVNKFGLPDYIEKADEFLVSLWFHSESGEFLFEIKEGKVVLATLAM